MTIAERNKPNDLEKLADAFFANLRTGNVEYGGWGLDDKRPFGNSDVEGDILEIIGWEPEKNDSYEQREYASELYAELGDYVAAEWQRRKGRS